MFWCLPDFNFIQGKYYFNELTLFDEELFLKRLLPLTVLDFKLTPGFIRIRGASGLDFIFFGIPNSANILFFDLLNGIGGEGAKFGIVMSVIRLST